MLQNNEIRLRRLSVNDAVRVMEWRFSADSYDCFYEYLPVTAEQNAVWAEASQKKENEINFIIETTAEKRPVGMISLTDIDMRSRKCEMGRVLIGERDCRGRGFGRQAVGLLLDYAFNHLNMHKIYCEVLADNSAAKTLYIHSGFKQDGLFKDHVYKKGAYRDVVHMACFKEKL